LGGEVRKKRQKGGKEKGGEKRVEAYNKKGAK
jgi:hypothetical protein